MKVLVTGGAGFCGSHVVDLLIEKGHKVVVLDNLSTGKEENISKESTLHKINVISKKEVESVFEQEKPDAVIHFAAQLNARDSIKNPLNDENINIGGTLNVLECCRNFGVKKIIYASSAAVYGDPEYLPVDEKHPIKPINQYGASKYSAELFIKTYSHLYGIDFMILRFSNVYGPRQSVGGETGVIALFADNMKKNKSITIFGDGSQTRDFIYVGDVAKATVLALEKNTNAKIMNVSTTKEISIKELAEKMKGILESTSEVKHSDPINGEINRSFLDNSIMKKELSFEDLTDLDEGLSAMLE